MSPSGGERHVPQCFVPVRSRFRAAYRPREELKGGLQASHLMIARMTLVAMLGAVLVSAVFLGFSVLTGSGPYDRPVIWLLFFVWIVCYMDIIMAVAMIAARQSAAAAPSDTNGRKGSMAP